METAIKATLISLTVSLLTNVGWDTLKFRRDNKFKHQNRIKHLYRLLKESNGQVKLQISNIDLFIEQMSTNREEVPLLAINAYHAIDYLSEKILNEEYYIAYLETFKSVINADDEYFKLRYSSVFVSTQLKQIFTIVDGASKRNYERKVEFNELHQKLQDVIQSIVLLNRENDRVFLQPILAILINYQRSRTVYGGIRELYNLVIKELVAVGIEHAAQVPFELASIIQKINYHYLNMAFQNEAIEKEISSLMPPLKEHLKLLNEIKITLDNPQISKFYK